MATVELYQGRIILCLGDVEHSLTLEESRDLLERLSLGVKELEIQLVYSSRKEG